MTVNDQPSDAMLEVMDHIVQHVKDRGYQPSMAEMAAHFGVTPAAIRGRLDRLVERGLVEPGFRDRAVAMKYIFFTVNFKKDES